MKKEIFRGAGVAIITPFTETGVNYNELGRIIEDQIAGGTDAIVITGTTGESATMTDAEHREAIRYTMEKVGGRIPVVAGTGSNETSYAIELSQYAEKVGADALLLVTPYYNKCTQNGLVAHYTKIADSVNIPAILYNVPSRTGVNIKTETYAALAKHPRIVGVKEASGDLSAILRMRAATGDDFAVYSGNDDEIVPILSVGGKYSFTKDVALAARYARNLEADNYNQSANIQLNYKGSNVVSPGSWGMYLAYRHLGGYSTLMPTFELHRQTYKIPVAGGEYGTKGWVVGASYAPMKNTNIDMAYFHGKSLGSGRSAKTFYTRVQMFW